MKPALASLHSTILVAVLAAAAAGAQVTFEDTELAGWSTEASGLLDRTVSGAKQAGGGNPGAHYLVRHEHEAFASFPTVVVSASLAPLALDPGELRLAGTPRFSVDLLFEVAYTPLLLAPTLYWTPILQQGEGLYRYRNPANVTLEPRDRFVRLDADLRPAEWIAPQGRPAVDLSVGAPPVRLGLLLETSVVVSPGTQGEARVRIDNIRLEAIPDGDLPAVSLVAVPSPGGGHVVFARPPCFDGLPDDLPSLSVRAEVEGEWNGCVAFEAPNLSPQTFDDRDKTVCFDPDFAFPASRSLFCGTEAPSFVELLPPPDAPGQLRARLGTPSRASVEPCVIRVAGGDLLCSELHQVCAIETVFGLLCRATGRAVPCYLENPVEEAEGVKLRGAVAASSRESASAAPVETLRRVRDEAMASTRAGRYYRDLYDAFSPELRDLALDDLGIVRDVFASAPPWLEALGALVDGQGGDATITPDMVADMLGIFDRFERQASPALLEVFRRERARLDLGDTAGLSIDEARDLLEQRGGPPPCAATDTSLCIQGGRFRVEVTWTDFEGGSGPGRAVSLSGDSGYFWFFDDDNVELVVKVLDGRTINDRYWVFYGALSNVEYTVLVTDTATGALRAYRNPSGVFASVGDTGAFTDDGAPREGAVVGNDGAQASFLADLSAAASETLRSGWRKVRRLFRGEPIVLSRAMPLATAGAQPAVAASACQPGPSALCLAGSRFRVEVEWRDFAGASGFGKSAPLTADTGTFWFFDPSNTELVVKVLDARAINDHFWVYYGALSNVEYTLRVTDTATGAVRTYENESGAFASQGDVKAF